VLPFGRLWYTEIPHAIRYAKFHRRSHRAVIRIYDAAGKVIETHEQVVISKSGSEGRQLRRPERGLSLSGANITMSYQADRLRCFTENQLSPPCWH
jgi:hypothetical protein